MIYLKEYKNISENYSNSNNYIEEVRNHIRDNDIEYFKNNSIEDYEYNEFIIIATMYGYKEIIELLIEDGIDVNQTNNPSRTAAYYTNNHIDILELLLDNGLDVSKEDDWNETFLEILNDENLKKFKNNKHIKKYLRSKEVKKFKI